jgi:hypothetical protein
MLVPSDVRMTRLKAAIDRCREGDFSAMRDLEIMLPADVVTVGALAKAAGDTFAYSLTQRMLGKHKDR